MLCKQKLCKRRWGAKQMYYATCFYLFIFLNRRLEAADALELLYCTRDKVERSGVGIPVGLHRGLPPGQPDPPRACASSPKTLLASVVHPNVLPRSADTARMSGSFCSLPTGTRRSAFLTFWNLHNLNRFLTILRVISNQSSCFFILAELFSCC